MNADDAVGYDMLLSFSGLFPTMDEERAFCCGVEFGDLYARMKAGREAEIEVTTHAANRTVILRAAGAEGWDIDRKPSGVEGWDYTRLTKIPHLGRPNPHGLHVVKSEDREG